MGSRIVVMKDGFIQQVDSPQNLYDYPANLFVGGFIGSPEMNFIDVTLISEGGAVYAAFNDHKVRIPEGKLKKLVDDSYIGKEVVLGIRPEDLHDEEVFIDSVPDAVVTATVDVVELLGAETLLYLTVAGNSMIARVDPRSTARAGDTIKIALDPNRIHLFDKETEKAIFNK
jgi:multiple sugar transport system ATP-binding protein